MAGPSCRSSTSITDLDIDTLSRCASRLSLRDISNMALSCKHLNQLTYSDFIWQSLYRQEWPHVAPLSHQASSIREAYLSRHAAVRQFKFVDPRDRIISMVGKPPQHILFDKNTIIFSAGPSIHSWRTNNVSDGSISIADVGNHKARISCMRLFSLGGAYLHTSQSGRDDKVLVTSSYDHYIRLWSKGGNRCFKGHNGPVFTLSDKLLGDDTEKLFASGGEDGTVRLWSINSSGNRGQHALKATLYGHDKPVSLMSVAGHKTSLLVSISTNGKVMVWDTMTASSSSPLSCSVGRTSVPVTPVAMRCHESLLYVAAGSSVMALDLRTMHRAFIVQQAKIYSFEILPSKSLLCTGGAGRAMLWDIRRVSDTFKAEPTVELDGHIGPVKHLHMDLYKVVTGGPNDPYVNIWDTDTGKKTNSLIYSDSPPSGSGCSGMAVDGCRIVTAGADDGGYYDLRFRDFSTATCRFSQPDIPETNSAVVSKFWGSESDSDLDGEPMLYRG